MTAPGAKRATLSLAKAPAEAPARPVEPLSVVRLQYESAHQFAARSASIAALGVNWVQHPAYVFQPRHSVHVDIWRAGRAEFIRGIECAAAQCRAQNPAYLRAAEVRAAMGAK